MRRLPRQVLIPGLGFAVTLGAAIVVSASAGRSPEARVHARATDYLQALYEEDATEAAAFHEDPAAARIERERASALGGLTWYVHELSYDDEGGEARVTVLWLTAEAAILREDVLVWREGLGGTWVLHGIDSPLPRRTRR